MGWGVWLIRMMVLEGYFSGWRVKYGSGEERLRI